MPLSINTNIASLTAQRSFMTSNAALETAYERLSTGKRINSASDDAAGLAIGKSLEARVSGINQAIRNVNDGISMVQIAEGTLDEVTTILQRMRDLSVQASNGSLSSTEKGYLDTEHAKLAASLDSVLDQAKFNTTDLIQSSNATFVIQSGATANDTTDITIDTLSASTLGVAAADLDLTTGVREVVTFTVTDAIAQQTGTVSVVIGGNTGSLSYTKASATTETVVAALNASSDQYISGVTWTNSGNTITGTFDGYGTRTNTNSMVFSATVSGSVGTDGVSFGIAEIDTALATIASDRATLGATQAQLESTVRNLANVGENTAAAASRIMDADYAAETANLTKAQILQQAATSVLAQANAQPQSVLALLQ